MSTLAILRWYKFTVDLPVMARSSTCQAFSFPAPATSFADRPLRLSCFSLDERPRPARAKPHTATFRSAPWQIVQLTANSFLSLVPIAAAAERYLDLSGPRLIRRECRASGSCRCWGNLVDGSRFACCLSFMPRNRVHAHRIHFGAAEHLRCRSPYRGSEDAAAERLKRHVRCSGHGIATT